MKISIPSLRALLPKKDKFRVGAFRAVTLSAMAIPLVVFGTLLRGAPASLTVPTTPAEFWAFVAGSAAVVTLSITVGVGFVAWYGLRAIRLAREDMVIRATRESRQIAMERAKEFSEFIKGPYSALQDELLAAEVPSFSRQVESGTPMFDDFSMYEKCKAWWDNVPAELQTKVIYLLNDLEAWSMYFTHAIADSQIVYEPCAPTFCAVVLEYGPWITVARKEQFEGFYPSVRALFNAWRADLDAQEGGTTTEAALRSARAIEERRAKHRISAPLGTSVDG